MTNLKQAMKAAKETGKRQKVTEPIPVDEVKVNVSIRLSADILEWLKTEAKDKGLPYQTLLNSLLVQLKNKPDLEERMSRLEKEVERLKKSS